MPLQNGVYKRLQSWVARAAAGAPISAVEFDADENDEATAISTALLRDGSGPPTVDIPFAGHALTGLRPGAAAGESVSFEQLATVGGAVNLLDNASFGTNQRGVSGTVTLAAGKYGHDRWKAGAGGCTYSFAQAGADVQINITAGSLIQVVPIDAIDAGTVTLQNAGTAQGRVYQGPVTSLAACPLQATLGTGVAANVEFGSGTVLQPQLSSGASVPAFARRRAAADVAACQRFYEGGYIRFTTYDTTGLVQVPVRFHATKAAVPTITTSGVTASPSSVKLSETDLAVDGFTQTLSTAGNGAASIFYTWSASCEP